MGFHGAFIMKNFLLSSLLLVLTCASYGAEPEVPETEAVEVEAAEIQGVLIERPDGRFMEFVLVENKIVCNFFDSKMQAIDPDVDRVAVRMQRRQPRVRNVFAVAIPFDGMKGLRAPIFIESPQLFMAYLSLMREGIKDPVEFYLIDYPDDLNAAEPIKIFDGEDPGRAQEPGY
jgi:hypothetical protein